MTSCLNFIINDNSVAAQRRDELFELFVFRVLLINFQRLPIRKFRIERHIKSGFGLILINPGFQPLNLRDVFGQFFQSVFYPFCILLFIVAFRPLFQFPHHNVLDHKIPLCSSDSPLKIY